MFYLLTQVPHGALGGSSEFLWERGARGAPAQDLRHLRPGLGSAVGGRALSKPEVDPRIHWHLPCPWPSAPSGAQRGWEPEAGAPPARAPPGRVTVLPCESINLRPKIQAGGARARGAFEGPPRLPVGELPAALYPDFVSSWPGRGEPLASRCAIWAGGRRACSSKVCVLGSPGTPPSPPHAHSTEGETEAPGQVGSQA